MSENFLDTDPIQVPPPSPAAASQSSIKPFLLGTVVTFLLCGVSFAGGIYVGKQMPATTEAQPTAATTVQVQPLEMKIPEGVAGPGRGYSFGPVDSPTQVQFWADTQCPYCAALDIPANQILKDATEQEKAHIEYFYSAFVNEHSQKVNNALACAYEQGKFYEFKDKAYRNQEQARNTDTLLSWGKELGISDLPKFKECVTTVKYGAYVNSVTDAMHAAGINKTPTLVINGESVLENQSLTFADLITRFGLDPNNYNDLEVAPSAAPTAGE